MMGQGKARLQLALVVVGCFLFGGCTQHPYSMPVIKPESSSFFGLESVSGDSRVLLVHGMCKHTKDGWVIPTNRRLADSLGAPQYTYDNPKLIPTPNPQIQLYKQKIPTAHGSLTSYSIVWSDYTTPLKKKYLCSDVTEATEVCDQGPYNSQRRASFNDEMKNSLLNDCLADAITYSGSTGIEIRKGVYGAVLAALKDGDPSAFDESQNLEGLPIASPLFLITESLGSKILFDALVEYDCKSQNSKELMQLRTALSATRQIFMEANQLPVLELAYEARSGNCKKSVAFNDYAYPELEFFSDLTKGISSEMPLGRKEPIKVVAFTDPNDLLSYELSSDKNGSEKIVSQDIEIINVLVGNGSVWFGKFENPLTAHQGYGNNVKVQKLIRCGYGGDKKSCE